MDASPLDIAQDGNLFPREDLLEAVADSDWRDRPVPIAADRVRCRQILTNLLSNAIKYTETGCVSVTLEPVEDERLGPAARATRRPAPSSARWAAAA